MITVLLLALGLLRVQAAPFSEAGPATDPTLAHTIVFGIQPRAAGAEATMRTLYDIVRSCVFTIAACVYRAIHQNIPDPTMTKWGRLRVRIKITFYALIAPEMMIWWAMRQRYGAIEIAKEVNGLNSGMCSLLCGMEDHLKMNSIELDTDSWTVCPNGRIWAQG